MTAPAQALGAGRFAWWRRFAADACGVAAIEFAFIAPVLVIFYLGAADAGQALMAARRVDQAAATIAQITSQAAEVDAAVLTDIFRAGRVTLEPFPDGTLTMRVSAVVTEAGGQGRVVWSGSAGDGGTARAIGELVTLPAGMAEPTEPLIVAEVRYVYASRLSPIVPDLVTFTETSFVRPRVNDAVTAPVGLSLNLGVLP